MLRHSPPRHRVPSRALAFASLAFVAACGSTSNATDAASEAAQAIDASDSAIPFDARDAPLPTDAPIGVDVPPATDGSTRTRCDPLPAPTGTIVRVTPGQANNLPSIVMGAVAGTTILLEDGNYRMTTSGESARRINFTTPNVTFRSASNNAAAVVIDGEYNTDEIIDVLASNVTIAHVTITHAVNHGVHLTSYNPGDLAGDVLYGVRLIDNGEQFIKVNANAAHTAYVDTGRVECSEFQLTAAGRMHVAANSGGSCYTGGIDNHGGRGWVVRRNTFEGIYCTNGGLAEHAIHFWHGSRDTVIEDNVIRDCARGVGLGLSQNDDPGNPARVYADNPYPGAGFIGDYDGIVRNNVISCNIAYYDTGIELDQAHGARVFHNTVVDGTGATGFFSSIDYRFANTLATIQNNFTRRITQRDGASGIVDHNVETTALSDFVDPALHDFHLRATATDAIDRGIVVPQAGLDPDGNAHTTGAGPDLGAYEYRP